ncbi:MAG: DUF1559 domain-containing protein [Planctomycetaceae bacterium]|nr:DUF1559 domain-containing protein [Planctomycetaceae bacterium]
MAEPDTNPVIFLGIFAVVFIVNAILVTLIFFWGNGLILPDRSSKRENPRLTADRKRNAIILSLSGLMMFPFVLAIPIAAFGRHLYKKVSSPMLMMSLTTFPIAVLTCGIFGLTALLLPAVMQAREAARRTMCRNNEKELSIWLFEYHDQHNQYPSAIMQGESEQPHSWRVEYAEQGMSLNLPYDKSLTWDSPVNQNALQFRPMNLHCPSSGGEGYSTTQTDLVLVTGENTLFSEKSPPRINTMAMGDGTSNTIIAGEATGLHIPWTEPRDTNTDKQSIGINLPGQQEGDSPGLFSSSHNGGCFVLMGDGSVQWFGNDIDPEILKSLTTPNGGELIDFSQMVD